ncbi:hypothetical protein [Campylobacter showae]|uniref:hypothetical protein n=1 Tax=Campylobacter showae TaxID=204 RepID=UPI000F090136|nr:hypothetical protein [Campylobacter showae]
MRNDINLKHKKQRGELKANLYENLTKSLSLIYSKLKTASSYASSRLLVSAYRLRIALNLTTSTSQI